MDSLHTTILEANAMMIQDQVDQGFDIIFNVINDLLLLKKFEQVDQVFSLDPYDLHYKTLNAIQAVTHTARRVLKHRKQWILRCINILKRVRPTLVEVFERTANS